MKKMITTSIVLFATCTLAALGLFLPDIAFSYQNRRIQETVNQEEMEPISFTCSSGLFDTMQLFALSAEGGDMSTTLIEGGNYTDSEILDIITDYVQILCDYGLITDSSAQPIEETFDCERYYLVLDTEITDTDEMPADSDTDSNNLLSARVYYGSVILSNNLEFCFYVDDQTGKVASFSYFPASSEELYDQESNAQSSLYDAETESTSLLWEDYDYYLTQLTSFLEDYYGYSISGYEWRDSYDSLAYDYSFEISDMDTEQILMFSVYIYSNDMIYFNCG